MRSNQSGRRLRGVLGTALVMILMLAAFARLGGIGSNTLGGVAKAAPVGSVSITSISVSSTCDADGGFTGTVTLSGNFTGNLLLGLYFHVTGTSTFQPSGLTDLVAFAGTNTATYAFGPFTGPPGTNTYRIQVAPGDTSGLGSTTIKSNSVPPCTPTTTTTTTTTTSTTTTPSTTTTTTSSTTTTGTTTTGTTTTGTTT